MLLVELLMLELDLDKNNCDEKENIMIISKKLQKLKEVEKKNTSRQAR